MFHLFVSFFGIRVLPRKARKRRDRRSRSAELLETRAMLTGPTAVNDTYYSQPYSTLSIPAYAGVLANDTGGNGPLSAVLVSNSQYGTVTLNSDGSFTYHNTSYGMGDSFTYEDYDGQTYSNVATVSINLSGQSAPYAQSDSYQVLHDTTLNVSAASGVLSNDGDPNHLHLTAVLESGPSNGSLTLNSDGSLSYTPASHWAGTVNFTYEAYDGNQYSSATTDTITVTNDTPNAQNDSYALTVTNDTPNAQNDSYALPNAQTFTATAANGVLANDGDPDGDTLTASLVSPPGHGSLTFNSDGSFSYTPNPGWVGYDTFTYQDSDGITTSNTAAVTLQTQYSVLSAVDQTKVPVARFTSRGRF